MREYGLVGEAVIRSVWSRMISEVRGSGGGQSGSGSGGNTGGGNGNGNGNSNSSSSSSRGRGRGRGRGANTAGGAQGGGAGTLDMEVVRAMRAVFEHAQRDTRGRQRGVTHSAARPAAGGATTIADPRFPLCDLLEAAYEQVDDDDCVSNSEFTVSVGALVDLHDRLRRIQEWHLQDSSSSARDLSRPISIEEFLAMLSAVSDSQRECGGGWDSGFNGAFNGTSTLMEEPNSGNLDYEDNAEDDAEDAAVNNTNRPTRRSASVVVGVDDFHSWWQGEEEGGGGDEEGEPLTMVGEGRGGRMVAGSHANTPRSMASLGSTGGSAVGSTVVSTLGSTIGSDCTIVYTAHGAGEDDDGNDEQPSPMSFSVPSVFSSSSPSSLSSCGNVRNATAGAISSSSSSNGGCGDGGGSITIHQIPDTEHYLVHMHLSAMVLQAWWRGDLGRSQVCH